jgi:hypothetical protein
VWLESFKSILTFIRNKRLENEIVALKNTIAAQSAVIQQLEQRLARVEAE